MQYCIMVFVSIALLSGCGQPPTEADRAELVGIWQPDDGSGKKIEFTTVGVFNYLYDVGYTLQLDWKLDRKGRVTLTSANGVSTTCQYTVAKDSLAIDNGSGAECVGPSVTPPSPMPRKFTRVN